MNSHKCVNPVAMVVERNDDRREKRRGKNHTEVLRTNLDSLRPVSIDVHMKRIMHRHCFGNK